TTMTKPVSSGSIPHGGALINRFLKHDDAAHWTSRASSLPSQQLTDRELSDIEMLATGAYSPLIGFMGQADYRAVVDTMRLSGGVPWSIPITLPLRTEVGPGDDLALKQGEATIAILHVQEVFDRDLQHEAGLVYKAT